jgi:hypothetical protein
MLRVEGRGDHAANEAIALQPVSELRVLVEVLLTIPAKTLARTPEASSDELRSDLIE